MNEISLFMGFIIADFDILFLFRSFRATLIAIIIVIIGVMWTLDSLIIQYQITVLTALVPTLVIVIGIPNCIFLTNKYQQEYVAHGNKARSITACNY
jgi:predicted RND superfamily exporter protein